MAILLTTNKEAVMKKLFICMFIAAIAFLCIGSKNDETTSERLADKILRLHVIANSDSEEDQNLKLLVKEELVNYIEANSTNLNDKASYINYINENKEQLKNIALQVMLEQGYGYNVELSVENTYFPVKSYGDLTFPCGYYDALCVRIGDASGKNWWCVLYPPLCFVDLTYGVVPEDSKNTLHTIVGDEDYHALLYGGEDVTVRPRSLIFDTIKEWFDN